MDTITLVSLVIFVLAVTGTVLLMGKLDKGKKPHHTH